MLESLLQSKPAEEAGSEDGGIQMDFADIYFQELRSEIDMEVLGDTEDLQIAFTAICHDGQAAQPGQKRCSNVKVGNKVKCLGYKHPGHT